MAHNFLNYLLLLRGHTLFLIITLLAQTVQAEPTIIEKANSEQKPSVSIARIYFTGEVTGRKTDDLIKAIDHANINYNSLQHIYLYINSFGGDMDGAYAAYWAVRSSRVPITAVNLGIVMSSASMIFCAAPQRESFRGAQFILHPAAIVGDDYSFQPDQLARASREMGRYNEMFRSTYQECTTFSEKELVSFLYSENSRKELTSQEALQSGLISRFAEKIVDGTVSYFISDYSDNDGKKLSAVE